MSLINDALKRATQAQPTAPPPAQTNAPMQPATGQRTNTLPAYFVPMLLLTLSLACWFLIKAWDNRRHSELQTKPATSAPTFVAARESVPASPASPPAISPSVQPASPPPSVAPDASTNSVTSPAVAPEPPKPAAPVFKLQGIFFRPSRPSAVVNAKTVYVGDKVGTASVKAITRESVTLEIGGQTEVLTLP